MLSLATQRNLDESMMRALRQNMASANGTQCGVYTESVRANINESKVVMLTSSSYIFRLFVLIYFDDNEKTRAHPFPEEKLSSAELTGQDFIDALCEKANMTCGAINRELGRQFTHLGLSTPNILDIHCVDHLEVLKPDYMQHFQLLLNETPLFHASLCICNYDALDIQEPPPEILDDTSSGELEFF